ncbi:LuxR family transcriptional regulator [Lentzea sp. NBRC 105346]|uniref:LuxR C-terminal-related transcriptional regulator n=1 Tax=Lentzea sp. NBRC 105346 TaxID=3032205 RepID=UPI0025567382|nr:LuxR family transcriptional regulator [Lentzea sp. NBRC 105346]
MRTRNFVGRGRELAEWRRILSRGGTLKIRGEAGIGKSRLVTEFARIARDQGVRVLRGGTLAQALAPVTRLGWPELHDLAPCYRTALSALLPEFRPVVETPGLMTAEAVVRLLGRSVLIIDDRREADAAVLDHLALAAPDVGLCLVTTERAPDGLSRLDAAEQHAMITDVLGSVPDDLVALIAERAEGVPLIIEEVLADLVRIGGLTRSGDGWTWRSELVPMATAPSVDAMVAARMRPELHAVVTAVAVLDGVVSWRDVEPVAGLGPDACARGLADLTAAQVLTAAGRGRFRFHHGLIRDAVLACASPSLVRETAARAAVRCEPARAARLHELAENHTEAARSHVEHARLLLAGGQLRAAEQAALAALRLADSRDAHDVLAEALTGMGRYAEALEVSARLDDADAHCRAARCALETGDHALAAAHLDRAGGAPASRVAALRATLAFDIGERQTALSLAAEAVRLADEPELLCAALLVSGRVARAGDPTDAIAPLTRLEQVATTAGLVEWRERAILELGLVDRATTMHPARLREARRTAIDRGALHAVALAEVNLYPVLLESGDVEQAQAVCDHAAEISARYGLGTGETATAMAAMLAAVRGRETPQLPPTLPNIVMYQAFRLLCTADPVGALTVLDSTYDRLRQRLDMRASPARGLHALLRAVLHDDPVPARRTPVDGIGSWTNRGLALLGEAVISRDGRLAERAYTDLSYAPTMASIATTLAAPRALAAGWGTPGPWLQAAHSRFSLLGNNFMRRHCERIMRDAGLPVPRRGRGDADVPQHLQAMGVTSREMDVLLLVASNLTNADIATRLSVSRRTVDAHVRSLLAKTGSARRGHLAGLVGAMAS